MSRFAASKYKHTAGAVYKKELWYPDLQPVTSAGEADVVAASAAWLAVAWSAAGAVALLPVGRCGKRATAGAPPLLHAHASAIAAMAFCPHDDALLATAAGDGAVRVWRLPEAPPSDAPADWAHPEPTARLVAELSGHKKKVDAVAWHPAAGFVLATGSSDKGVRVWDVAEAAAAAEGAEALRPAATLVLDDFAGDAVQSLCWSRDGARLVAGCKDKKVRVVDPRKPDAVQVADGHPGIKASRCVWLGKEHGGRRFVTTGASRMRERQVIIWDAGADTTAPLKPLKTIVLDTSTGVLDVFYDQDTQLLYLAGKGDGSIKVLDMDNAKPPHYKDLTVVQTDVGQKSVCMAPKRACNVMNTEVALLFQLTQDAVAPVGFSVPRKTKSEFHKDLFPPTLSPEPALTADAWFGGEDKEPVLFELTPDTDQNKYWLRAPGSGAGAASAGAAGGAASPSSSSSAGKQEEADSSAAAPAAAAVAPTPKAAPSLGGRMFAPKPEAKKEEPRVFRKVQVVRSSHYRHIHGEGTKKEQWWDDLKVSTSANTSVVKANSQYFAVPWAGAGGRVAILNMDKPGRQVDTPFLELGSDCLDFDWNPFNDGQLACVTENAAVQIWDVPAGGLTANLSTPTVTMKGHMRRVQVVEWHPWASGILATSSYDLSVRVWDAEKGAEALKISDGHDDHVMGMSWDYTGNLLATSSRDKHLRLVDVRAGKVVLQTLAHDGAKGFRACWLGNRGQLASVGHSRMSERMLTLWDARKFGSDGNVTSMKSVSVDNGAGLVTPHFDEDINVLYCAGKGEGTVKMFEINDTAPFVHYLTAYTNPVPAQGMALLPKSTCDVRKVEIARWIKLANGHAEAITFTVPRTRTEFFQDDVYADTRDFTSGAPVTGAAWLGGGEASPKLRSLCPSDMTPLSEAPELVKEKRVVEVAEEGIDQDKMKERVLDAFHAKMVGLSSDAPLPDDLLEGAGDDEWDD